MGMMGRSRREDGTYATYGTYRTYATNTGEPLRRRGLYFRGVAAVQLAGVPSDSAKTLSYSSRSRALVVAPR